MLCQYGKGHYVIISPSLEIKDNSGYIRMKLPDPLNSRSETFLFNIQYLGLRRK